jgi:hypothetical protein
MGKNETTEKSALKDRANCGDKKIRKYTAAKPMDI